MNDQMFDSLRKAAESSLQMQQDMFKQWSGGWTSTPFNAAGVSAGWIQKSQKRRIEFTVESLTKHRESLDSLFKSGIQVIEQSCRLSEAKTPDDYRRLSEDLLTFYEQSDRMWVLFRHKHILQDNDGNGNLHEGFEPEPGSGEPASRSGTVRQDSRRGSDLVPRQGFREDDGSPRMEPIGRRD